MLIDKSTSNTKYAYITNELLRRINSEEFSRTGRIPSENELSKAYNVSVITVRKALSDLVHTGKIIRIKGKGSFVASRAPETSDAPSREKLSGKGIVPLILLSYENNDSQFVSIVSGAQTYLSQQGYLMTIECSNHNVQTESEILTRCIRDKASGVLIFSTDPNASAGKLAELRDAGIPFVMLDRTLEAFPVTMVSSYHFDGTFQVTRLLLRQGHRRIIYMANELSTNVHRERLLGYKAALEQTGVSFREEFCLTQNYSQLHHLDELIQNRNATAVVCLNDLTGITVMDYLKSGGYRIPQDISVTGFDDSELGRYADLTSVRQQFREIGRLGAEKLLQLIGKEVGHSRSRLPVEVVVRGSTGPVKEKIIDEHDQP